MSFVPGVSTIRKTRNYATSLVFRSRRALPTHHGDLLGVRLVPVRKVTPVWQIQGHDAIVGLQHRGIDLNTRPRKNTKPSSDLIPKTSVEGHAYKANKAHKHYCCHGGQTQHVQRSDMQSV